MNCFKQRVKDFQHEIDSLEEMASYIDDPADRRTARDAIDGLRVQLAEIEADGKAFRKLLRKLVN